MVAIYARQSVDKKDSISIESQIESCQKELDGEEFIVFADKGYSGKNTDRPQFSEMMSNINSGLIKKVIVYKIDRISRALIDFSTIMENFKKNDVEFVSRSEKFDTSTPMGKAMLNIIMVFAELERETIQMRIKDNYYARGRQGFYLGGVAPFGYNKTEIIYRGKKTYTFVEDKVQADIVRGLFEEYSETDISLGKLAQKLTKSEVFTNRNNNWNGVSLGRLFRNPVYVRADSSVYAYLKNKGAIMNNEVGEFKGENGCYVYAHREKITKSKFTDLKDSYVTIALHEGIIPSEIWLKCQHKLDNNKQVKNSGKGSHSWLSGTIKCGYCGYAINVVNNRQGNSYITCGGKKLNICPGRKRAISICDIEKIVEDELLSHIKSFKSNPVKVPSVHNFEINQLNIKRIQTEEKINNLMNNMSVVI